MSVAHPSQLGAIADRLTSKKRQLKVEPFLNQFVLPQLSNQKDPFLRSRACWTYRQFIEKSATKKFDHPQQLLEAFLKIVDLCSDQELPIRVMAAITLGAFLDIEQEDIKTAISSRMPVLMEKLLIVMAQVPNNDMIITTLENLVSHFGEQIPPYAVELVRYLAAAFLRMVNLATRSEKDDETTTTTTTTTTDASSPVSTSSEGDEEDFTLSAMSFASAISR